MKGSIELDYTKSKLFSDAIHRYYYIPRKELHLSDDPKIQCPLKVYCRLKDIKPELNRRTIAIFLMGKVFGAMMEEAYKEGAFGLSKEIFTQRKYQMGVGEAHPDIMDGGYPIELKHTRRNIMSSKDIPEKWLHQLALECVYTENDTGYLGILSLDSCLVTIWKVTFDTDVLRDLKEGHMSALSRIKHASDHDNPEELKPNRKECSTCFYNYFPNGCPKSPNKPKEKPLNTKEQLDKLKEEVE